MIDRIKALRKQASEESVVVNDEPELAREDLEVLDAVDRLRMDAEEIDVRMKALNTREG